MAKHGVDFHMKEKILNMLKKKNEVVSGEKLSSELGVSRVSIWKHIRSLQDAGYDIVSHPRGYQLVSSHDALFPWEFPGRTPNMHYFTQTSSTMDAARQLARDGCPQFTVVVAERQSNGRGRLQRTWYSSEGGLYFTTVLRPQLPLGLSFRVNFCASLVLARQLRQMFDIPATVKWPNDILVGTRKLCGMLSEMEAESDAVSFVNIGIGLNVNNDPTPDEPRAVSLKTLLGREVSRKDILRRFLDEFEHQVTHRIHEDVIPEWKTYTSTLNQQVRIVTVRETTEGLAVDVDDTGALVLKLADGSLKKIIYGDCFYRDR